MTELRCSLGSTRKLRRQRQQVKRSALVLTGDTAHEPFLGSFGVVVVVAAAEDGAVAAAGVTVVVIAPLRGGGSEEVTCRRVEDAVLDGGTTTVSLSVERLA